LIAIVASVVIAVLAIYPILYVLTLVEHP
jgi:hypothetical protein